MLERITAFSLLVVIVIGPGCSGSSHPLYDQEPGLRYGERPAVMSAAEADPPEIATENAPEGLPELSRALLESSPTIAAARERYRAAIEAVPQATRLPDLSLEFTWLPLPVETRVGANTHRLGLKQVIPFPSKLMARDDGARAGARRAAIAYDRVVRDELIELAQAYAELVYAEEALIVIGENKAIAELISQLGATRYGADRGLLSDIAKAESQRAQLDFDQLNLTEKRDLALTKVNSLLSRPSAAAVSVQVLPFEPLEVETEALYALALAHQQELAILDEGIAQAEAQEALARSNWLPDISLGAQIMFQDEAAMTPAPADSGALAVGLSFGLKIPLSFHANWAASAAADAQLNAAILDKQSHLDELEYQVQAALINERNAARRYILYSEELLPQALAALETAEAQAHEDAAAYADLLEARAAYYAFQLASARARADHFIAVAQVEKLVGAALVNTTSSQPPQPEEEAQ